MTHRKQDSSASNNIVLWPLLALAFTAPFQSCSKKAEAEPSSSFAQLEKIEGEKEVVVDPIMTGFVLAEEKQAELFRALNYDDPAFAAVLAPVQEAFLKGDMAAARKALANHLRTRNQALQLQTYHLRPQPAPVPAADAASITYDKEVVDAAAEGKVQGGLVKLYATFPGNRINWQHNETRNQEGGRAYNPEWQWQLNRTGFWHELAKAYRVTGDEKYARAWVIQMRSFIATCPPPPGYRTDNSHGSSWRTIETGLRMVGPWPHALHSFLYSPSVTDDDLILYMHCSMEHARHLLVSTGSGNWLTMEMNGLFTVGSVFPEFKDAASWRATAFKRLHGEISWQFLPDGSQFELTPGYHNVALDNLISALRLAKSVNRLGEVPQDYVNPIEHAWEYNMRLMTPDRSLPKLNDSWPFEVPRSLSQALEYFPHREDFRWIATEGEKGVPPTPAPGETTLSHAFTHAGYYVMRSGWERDANYVLFDAGPLGAGHVHQDKLNLVFYAWGRELLFDGGGGSYEESPWRAYGIDTFSHNTVLVDGLPQRRDKKNFNANVSREPLQNVWHSTPEYDYVRGSYEEGYGKLDNCIAKHVRRVHFFKPDLVVVADTLLPNDDKPHSYQARWHLLTTNTRVDGETNQVVTSDAGQPNLAVVPLSGGIFPKADVAVASAQTEPEILGWDVRKDTEPQCVPATTVIQSYNEATGATTFLTLLLPLPSAADTSVNPVVIQQSGTAENHYTVTVALSDGRRFEISCPPDPNTQITVTKAK